MVFIARKQLLKLNQEEQKTLQAFGRTSFSRKSNLAIESQLTPSQIDVAVNNLQEKGLVKIEPEISSQSDQRIYLTWKGNQVRRKIGISTVEYPTKIAPNINERLEEKIKSLKSKA